MPTNLLNLSGADVNKAASLHAKIAFPNTWAF